MAIQIHAACGVSKERGAVAQRRFQLPPSRERARLDVEREAVSTD